jgi:hypothetical protein
MAVGSIVARILTEYSDKGTKQAVKDISKMEKKFGDYANRTAKAFGLAAVAAGAFAVKIGTDAVQGAMEDQKQQVALATALRNTTGATDEAIAATTRYLDKLELMVGVDNNQLIPSLQILTQATKDVTQAQNLQALALDVSAGTGKDLQAVSIALAKAVGGNVTALTRLGVPLDAAAVKSKDLNAILGALAGTFKGQAEKRAQTFEFQIIRLRLAFNQILDQLGYALIPHLEKFANIIRDKVLPALSEWIKQNGEKLAGAFKTGISYGVAFFKLVYDLFSFVARNSKVFAVLGATIVAAFFGAKVAGAVTALVGGIQAIIKVMKALRTVSLASAAATALATGGVSAAAGAAAFGVALVGIGLAAKKFNNDSDKAADALGEFGVNLKGLTATADDYTKGLDAITTATGKLTDKEKEELKVQEMLLKLKNKFKLSSKDLASQDPITLEAIRKNQVRQAKLGLSSPTISLAASAGHGNIAGNTTMNGGNITVNVAGSVVSQGDLVAGIKNGLEVIYRRRGGSGYAVL